MHLNNLIKRSLLTILGIIFLQSAFSQENYIQGFVVNPDGDTIHGLIDYRNWKKNPDKISFKKQASDNPIIHTPLSIKYFGVADEIYAGAIVETDLSRIKTDELEHGKEPKIKVDTIFLQSIILGTKSLYLYNTDAGRELFYILQDTTFNMLIYKRYLSDIETSDIKENKKYLSQLAVYLKDCPTIQQNFKSLQYSRKSLEKLFLTYYDCVEKPLTFQKKQEKLKAEFGAIAGLTLNNLAFGGEESIDLTKLDFKTDVSYSIGTYINLVLARNQGKWSLYNELAFSPYKVENYSEYYVSENEYTYYTTTLGYSYLKLNTMVRFSYPFGKTSVFINAGMSNGYALSETNQINVEKKFYSSETNEDFPVLAVTRLYEQGIIAGLGGKYDKFSFEFRFERGNGMSAMMNLDSKTTRYLFLLGYKF
jgi:hypothetical protein